MMHTPNRHQRRCFLSRLRVRWFFVPRTGVLCLVVLAAGLAGSESRVGAQITSSSPEPDSVLTPQQWNEVDEAVERGLEWLASQQQRNGSFPTNMPPAQPGVTGLCVLAFMAHGHLPGEGKYGDQIDKALEFILGCQKQSGLLALVAPQGPTLNRNIDHAIGYMVPYDHGIAGLVLSEAYAMNSTIAPDQMQEAIQRAMKATLEMQLWPKRLTEDEGGWRYLDDYTDDMHDSDLSATGWHLMFLRSAKNAGFDVADKPIKDAIAYVRRTFSTRSQSFSYTTMADDRCTRGMAGAGVLALAHAGLHNTPEARQAGRWILANGFADYNGLGNLGGGRRREDRYHYGLLTCCPAMYQLGGDEWQEFFPPTVDAILSGQDPSGGWDLENFSRDQSFGNVYTSAICLFALGAPNQFLPVFQR